jgi:chromosome segregation ATPase
MAQARKMILVLVALASVVPAASSTRLARDAFAAQREKKEYLTELEADKIRDAETTSERIKLFVGFADDRLKKFQYELTRSVPQRKRIEVLNALMNAYASCVDDAADQIAVAQEKQQDIHDALKLLQKKGKEFSEILAKLDEGGPDFDTYKDTLEDAIEGTRDAISDAEKAEKEMLPAPVRRKPS